MWESLFIHVEKYLFHIDFSTQICFQWFSIVEITFERNVLLEKRSYRKKAY